MQISIPVEILRAAADNAKNEMQMLIENEKAVDGFTDNQFELEATNAFFDSLVVVANVSDDSVQVYIPDADDPWGETMEEGTNPVSGGNNGTVTFPDGHTEQSKVPRQLWGHALPWLATAGSMWHENVMKKAKTLIPQVIQETVSQYSDEIAKHVSKIVGGMLQEALGGA